MRKKPSQRLLKSIDRINNILYHLILMVYMIIAICAIFAFRSYAWEAVSAGKEKMKAIYKDMHKAVGLDHNNIPQKEAYNPTNENLRQMHSIAFTDKARKAVTAGSYFIQEAKSEEMQKYTMSLVFWNMIFLLPLYFGLFTSDCNSSLIKTFG